MKIATLSKAPKSLRLCFALDSINITVLLDFSLSPSFRLSPSYFSSFLSPFLYVPVSRLFFEDSNSESNNITVCVFNLQ